MTTTKRKQQATALTNRDFVLLKDLYEFGVLTTSQIAALHFLSAHRARKRLAVLWKQHLVARFVRPVRMGDGTSEYHYVLTKRGSAVLSTQGLPAMHVERRYRRSINDHALRINDFHIAVRIALRYSERFQLLSWRQGNAASLQFRVFNHSRLQWATVIPDSLFIISMDKRNFGYFLEIDRGTTDLQRVHQKLAHYLRFWETGDFAKAFPGLRSFRVLVVTTSDSRKNRMLQNLAIAETKYRRKDIIAITTFSAYSLSTPHQLFTPIWKCIDVYGNRRTVSPLPPLTPITLPSAPSNSLVRRPDTGAR